MKIIYSKLADGAHRIEVQSDRLETDSLMFVFTHEGLVIDAQTGGIVEATSSEMYDEIENRLTPQ